MLNFSYICTVKRLMGNRISRTATILTASPTGILIGKREIQVWQPKSVKPKSSSLRLFFSVFIKYLLTPLNFFGAVCLFAFMSIIIVGGQNKMPNSYCNSRCFIHSTASLFASNTNSCPLAVDTKQSSFQALAL